MHYYVFIWAEGSKKWSPISSLTRGPLGIEIHFDSNERLSYEEAELRYRLLSKRYPLFRFKVDELI